MMPHAKAFLVSNFSVQIYELLILISEDVADWFCCPKTYVQVVKKIKIHSKTSEVPKCQDFSTVNIVFY